MNARSLGLFLGALLLASAILRVPRLYRDVLSGRLDIAELLRFRFDIQSGAMVFAVAVVMP